jgi:signal transduction histidine kinase
VGLTVTDDAPQIPASDQARVFERFYRAEEARAGGAAGGGLGLAICQEVALAHGGRIWLEAATGGGNSFSVALPAWRAESDAERHLPPASSSRGAEAGASSPAARHGDG